MKSEKLRTLIKRCWSSSSQFILNKSECVVTPSIPILWFGNMEEYFASDIKIITVALNPSSVEFQNTKNDDYNIATRFPEAQKLYGKWELSDTDTEDYYNSMNNYFAKNPYTKWFGNFERPLNAMNASYDSNRPYPNRAINIDIYTPIATNPTWRDVNNSVKLQLREQFSQIFDEFVEYLNPDIIIVSAKRQIVEEVFDIGNQYKSIYSTPEVQKKGRKDSQYIRAYKNIKDDSLLITALNRRGSPFGGMDTETFINKHIEEIIKLK